MDADKSRQRYDAIADRIAGGITAFYPSDVRFYLDYCNRNRIVPTALTADPSASPVLSDIGRQRYSGIMERLEKGRSIEAAEYQFLKRYCRRAGLELPAVESRMQFWLREAPHKPLR